MLGPGYSSRAHQNGLQASAGLYFPLNRFKYIKNYIIIETASKYEVLAIVPQYIRLVAGFCRAIFSPLNRVKYIMNDIIIDTACKY